MSAHAVYDSATGAILKVLTISGSLPTVDAFLAANTPSGAAAMDVPETHPALLNQAAWKVSAGQLVAVPQPDPSILAAARTAQIATIQTAYQAAVPAQIAQYLAAFAQHSALLARIEAAQTVAEVDAVVWS